MSKIDKEGEDKEEKEEEVFLEAAAFSKMDPRLRSGLPLLTPIVSKSSLSLGTTSKKTTLLQLEYSHYFRDIGTSINS